MYNYIKLLRVKHWIKNLLVFLPLFFSGMLFDTKLLLISLVSFFLFSFVSSSIYILNDINDIESDRKHPKKKNRPLASGAISIKKAYFLLSILIIVSFGASLLFSIYLNNYFVLFILLFYFVLNILYSKKLKHYAIIDVVIIAFGFLLRLFLGAVVTGISISNWLYLMVMFASFYMGFGKRRNEIIQCKNDTRKVLKKYNKEFLDKNMYMCLTLSIVCYSLWCVDITTIERIGNNYLILTVPVVMIMLLIYSLDIEGNSDGDPVEVILKNKLLLFMTILYSLLILLIIYVF